MTSRASQPAIDLAGKRVILGVSGGIAAYKAALVVRLLKQRGAEVQVLMTPDATRFIAPLTLGTLSGRDVLIEIFPEDAEGGWTRHVHLGEWADLFVVAPATAQTIAKLAYGFCDSMLTATALSARCRLLVCPAMDHEMYHHPATQANLERLRSFDHDVMPPDEGELASGIIGSGRLPEPEAIVARIADLIAQRPRDLDGRKVVITAGPTREPIDPVRYLTNHSSGKMGYALAEAARDRGATVVLVSGPVDRDAPQGVTRVSVESAEDMLEAVEKHMDADVFVMAAAVADYRPATVATSKIKKSDEQTTLHLAPTPDILASVCRRTSPDQFVVGFALETDDPIANARRKLSEKGCDLIVLNNPRDEGSGFGTDTNRVTLIDSAGGVEELALLPKRQVADEILSRAHALMTSRTTS